MSVIALSASSNAYATNEKPVSMFGSMFNNYADMTPLTVMATRLGARSVKNVQIDWTEDEEVPHTVTASADGSTTLTITNYTYLRRGDLIFNPRTKELIRVSTTAAVPPDATVEVTRGIGSTSEATVLPTDTLQIIAPSIEEAEDSAGARQVTNTNQYNYTQIINHFIHTSKSALNETTYFGPKRVQNQKKMWREYRIKVEKNLYFGYRASASGSTYNYRTMGGLVEKLATGTNVYTVPGVLTETGFDNWLVDVYTSMPDQKQMVLFGSPKLISIIASFGKDKVRLSPNSKMYGLWADQYTGSLKVDLVRAPLLSGDDTINGWGFLLDMSKVSLAYLRKPVLLKNTYTERAEYVEDKIESELSLIVAIEKASGFIEGVSG